MKKIIAVFALSVLTILAACSTAAAPVEMIDGYALYDNVSLGLRVQHPERWMAIDTKFFQKGKHVTLYEEEGLDVSFLQGETYKKGLMAHQVFWMDFYDELYAQQLALTMKYAEGSTFEDLVSDEGRLRQKEIYGSLFNDSRMVESSTEIRLGNNAFARTKYDINLFSDEGQSVCQFVVFGLHNRIYYFTLITPLGMLEERLPECEKMLSTLEFI